jgi:polynucleotide 5'-hydroxyl-kinase GRC3/NOL9
LNMAPSSVILVLNPSETLSFIGTTQLVLLHGKLKLFGVTISASPLAHPIFAPRSHPIPSLEAFSQTVALRPNIPGRIRSACRDSEIIIALGGLRTGVHGLGNACRVFQRVFDGQAQAPWTVPGLYPIVRLFRRSQQSEIDQDVLARLSAS